MNADQRLCIDTQDHRAMMLHEEWWPGNTIFPSLGLKHQSIITPYGMPRTARLVMGNEVTNKQFIVHQWDDTSPMEFAGDPAIYETVDQVLAAGWIVD